MAFRKHVFLAILLAAASWLGATGSIFDDTISVHSSSPEGDKYTIFPENDTLAARLTVKGGSGWSTYSNQYVRGIYSVKIKYPPGYTAGVVVAYYLIQDNSNKRDEIDFELLGSVNSSKVIIHTNFYGNGNGSHVEQFNVWFDVTKFHKYTIRWNSYHVVWMVDDIPIREHIQDWRRPWGPDSVLAPMRVSGTIWDASPWATRINGKTLPVNYTYAPYQTVFAGWDFNKTCQYRPNVPQGNCNSPAPGQKFPWDGGLTTRQKNRLRYYRSRYLSYSRYLPKGKPPRRQGGHPPGVGGHRKPKP